jgi:hypothetical protein
MKTRPLLRAAYAAAVLLVTASEALAADGFKLRFPISGTLGGEIVAPLPTEGTFGSVVVTDVNVSGVTGNDGNNIQLSMPVDFGPIGTLKATALATAAAVPDALKATVITKLATGTASTAGSANLNISNYHQTVANATLGHVLSKDINGGKLVAVVNIPYVLVFDTSIKISGSVPAVVLSTAATPIPGDTVNNTSNVYANTIANTAIASNYKTSLASKSSDASISTYGLGDIEASLLWEKSMNDLKVVAGATLAMPTGNYKYTAGSLAPNIGYGNYYTLRTGLGVAYTASETMTLGARGSLGFNSQNTDNYVRSGDFYALDLAAAFRTPVGVVGPHITMLQQYTDDTGGTRGANRVSVTGAGFFYTVPIAAWGAGLNIAYMKTTDTKNSLVGDFIQFRFSKVF